MDKNRIIVVLREHEPELRAAGIVHLRLFGSVARDEATSRSDVDLLAELDHSRRIGLITISGIQNKLTDLLGAEVHLTLANSLHPQILDRANQEAFPAF